MLHITWTSLLNVEISGRYQDIFFIFTPIFYFHLELEKERKVFEKFVLKAHLRLSNLFLIATARAKLYITMQPLLRNPNLPDL